MAITKSFLHMTEDINILHISLKKIHIKHFIKYIQLTNPGGE